MMNGRADLSAILPDGREFDFWEEDCTYTHILYVDCQDPAASDENDGSKDAPFQTISRAAALASPGTKILIRAGIYRECVRPAAGGTDPTHMISYEAYPGEEVCIRASEEVTDFSESTGWKLRPLPEFSDRGLTVSGDHSQNTRITSNLFLDGIEQREAIFIECTKEGTNLIDNNVIWNVEGRFDPSEVPSEPGSSGWYKMKEHDVVNGYGVYCEGTDRLIVAHNLIGKCRHSGYYAKPVSFRMGGLERGGTSRKARILNNIFYDCAEAAIVFPTQDNESEGNLFLCMSGGYLRVMYPAPELCLDLDTWREFCGYDLTGNSAWFGFRLEDGKLSLEERKDSPVHAPGPAKPVQVLRDPSKIRKRKQVSCVPADITGRRHTGKVLPGPFSSWEDGMTVIRTERNALS